MEIRPLRWPDEIPVWAALHTAVNPDRPAATARLESFWDTMHESAVFLALDGPDAVAFGWVGRRGWARLPWARISVLPGHRRQGIGSALFARLSECAAGHGYGEIEAYVREVHADGLEFAAHRGFVEIGRAAELELDLTAIGPVTVEPPDGVEIVTWAERPELTRGIYEVDLEAAPDEPGGADSLVEPLEQWLESCMSGSGTRRELVFVALSADGECIGYSQLSVSETEPAVLLHGFMGVKRAWRGRGVAGALRATQIRRAQQLGCERLRTDTDDRNAPMLRLNERFGYRPLPGQVHLRGPIAGARA